MASAGSIFVDLLLNDAKFSEGTKRASKSARAFKKDMEEFGRTAGTAIGVATAALTALTVQSFRTIDATGKLARQLGVATESFQALSLVADEAGVSQEKLGNLFGKAQKAIVEAVSGSDGLNEAFARIGLSARDLINLAPDEQFARIAEALSKIENPTIRNATALQIFSKAGRDAVNMLEDFRAKADEAREFNDRFNVTFSDIDSRVVEEANDAFGRLGKAVQGLGNTIAIQVAPLITELSNLLLNAGVDGQTMTDAVAGGFKLIGGLIDQVRQSLLGLKAIFIDVAQLANRLDYNAQLALEKLSGGRIKIDPQTVENLYQGDIYRKQTQEKINNFQSIPDKISNIQNEARMRAQAASSKSGGALGIDLEDMGAAKKATDDLNRLYEKNIKLITGMDDATLQYKESMNELSELLKAGKISQEEYNGAVARAQEEFKKASESADLFAFDVDAATKRAAENIQDNLADFLFDPADKGFKGMLKGFVDVLRRMAAEAASAQILKTLFGGAGGSAGGFFDNIIGGLFGGGATSGSTGGDYTLGPSTLPGFASGIDTVPRDMAAVIHKDEAVLNKQDAAAWRSGSAGNRYVFNVGTEVNQRDIRRLEQMILQTAGPGVVESRVDNAQARGML